MHEQARKSPIELSRCVRHSWLHYKPWLGSRRRRQLPHPSVGPTGRPLPPRLAALVPASSAEPACCCILAGGEQPPYGKPRTPNPRAEHRTSNLVEISPKLEKTEGQERAKKKLGEVGLYFRWIDRKSKTQSVEKEQLSKFYTISANLVT